MVIVSRYLDNAKSYDDDLITSFGIWLFTKTINIHHGGKYTDATVIYRAYKKKIIDDLDLMSNDGYHAPELIFKTKISWEPPFSVRAAKKRLNIKEIPGNDPKRIGGERKLQILKWGATYYLQFIRELWFWKK